MEFRYHLIERFPRLAWCARLRRGAAEVDVFHGPWVEVRSDRFFEGAWDGDFAAGDFDQAEVFGGTGAWLTGDGVAFSTSTDLLCGIYSVHVGDDLWLSGSLANLLVRIGDRPDPRHASYRIDFAHARIWGIRPYRRTLPTANGNRVSLHLYSNVFIGPDLKRIRREKPQPPEPADFAEYRDLLAKGVAGLVRNARDPGRKVSFEPVTAVSRGYDSPAVAVLASEAGCKQAIAIYSPVDSGMHEGDDGTRIAAALGMQVARRGFPEYLDLPPEAAAEACAALPSGAGILKGLFETELAGSLLLTGFNGDVIWSLRDTDRLPKMMGPAEKNASEPTGYADFRARVGFFHFAPAYIGCIHRVRLHAIAHSEGMAPWYLPVPYNRPIARRIAEEAGIPRESFGQRKQAGGATTLDITRLSPDTRADYEAFCRANGLPSDRAIRRIRMIDLLTLPFAGLYWLSRRRWGRWLYHPLAPLLLLSDHRLFSTRRRADAFGYSMHWGFERIRGRYAIGNQRVGDSPIH